MTVFSIICGVLLIIGGISCLFTPIATFLSIGYYVAILLLIYSISGIVRSIGKKVHVPELILGILGVIVACISLARPGSILLFDTIMLYIIATWFIIQGIMSIFISIKVKNVSSGWVWGLIAGILGVIVGILSFAHPAITALTAGIMIGLYFIEAGIDLIAIAFAVKKVEEVIEA